LVSVFYFFLTWAPPGFVLTAGSRPSMHFHPSIPPFFPNRPASFLLPATFLLFLPFGLPPLFEHQGLHFFSGPFAVRGPKCRCPFFFTWSLTHLIRDPLEASSLYLRPCIIYPLYPLFFPVAWFFLSPRASFFFLVQPPGPTRPNNIRYASPGRGLDSIFMRFFFFLGGTSPPPPSFFFFFSFSVLSLTAYGCPFFNSVPATPPRGVIPSLLRSFFCAFPFLA